MTSRLLVDNFFNPRVYGSHVLSSNENTDNTPLIGAARRSTYDAWTPSTLNADAWNKSRNDQQRSADMIVIDRGHTSAGKTVKAQLSDDDFTLSIQDAFNGALPTVTAAGMLTDAFGVVTPEGVWLKRFDQRWGHDWRAYYVAMGAGLKPIIPGLWIGQSWSPGLPWRPHSPEKTELVVEETQSDRGHIGRGAATRRKGGVLRFKFGTLLEAEEADWHIQRIAEGHAFWIIADEDRGDLAFLAVVTRDVIGTQLDPGYYYPTLDLPFVEWSPNA
jgi:hypothetical protein